MSSGEGEASEEREGDGSGTRGEEVRMWEVRIQGR